MAPPPFVSVSALASGTGDITVTLGTHASGDRMLLMVETANSAVGAVAGWDPVPGGIVGTGTTSRITLLSRLAASASETNPTITDTGDHQAAAVIVFSDAHATDWFAGLAGALIMSATTALVFPSMVTPKADCTIVNIYAWAIDNAGPIGSGEANALLTNLTERLDAGTVDANGGGLLVYTGELATAGDTGNTTCTTVNSLGAVITIAISATADAAGLRYPAIGPSFVR